MSPPSRCGDVGLAMRGLASWLLQARTWRTILTAVVAAIGVRTCMLFAAANARGLDFSPVNGTFQTFNPVRRLALGQHIGRDFDAYLGLGPTYLTRLASLGFGEHYRGVLTASHLITALSFWVTLVILGRLCALSMLGACTLAAVVTALATQSQPAWIPHDLWVAWVDRTWPLVAQGNSLLGLRALLPCLAVLVLAASKRWLRIGEPGLDRRTALVVGATAGASAIWSNDYGIPTAGLLISGTWLQFRHSLTGGPARYALWTCASALASATLIVTVATAGFPLRWFEYNFLGVARDQAWYFASANESPVELRVPLLGVAALLLLLAKSAHPSARPTDPWLAIVVAATLAAGAVPSLSSSDPRYFFPLERCLWLVGPYLFVEGSRLAWARIELRRRAVAEHVRERSLLGAAIGFLAATLASWPVLVEGRVASAHPWPTVDPVHLAELGGDGPGYMAKMAVLGREIRSRAESTGVPRERRLFSTYASALEVFADALQPTGDDYVIHALGPARRAAYVKTLVDLEPLFVSTLRVGKDDWEPWVQCLNWDLYREILARYEPFEQTVFHTLWRRRATPLPACAATLEVLVRAEDSDPVGRGIPVEVRFPPQAGWPDDQILLGEIEIEYEVHSHRLVPLPCTPLLEDPFMAGKVSSFGFPPYETVRRFPIALRPGLGRTLFLQVSPEGSGSIRVRAAHARSWGPFEELMRPKLERLLPADFSDTNWRNGVARWPSAVFFVDDIDDVRGLGPGSELRCGGSGQRSVRKIVGREVWLDGPPLDPGRDGFPNWIEIVRP